MRTRSLLLILIILVLLGAVVYYGYRYIKERPPRFLISLVTRTEPPPPLPQGDFAPLMVPEGFTATIFARDIAGARVMTRDPKGTLVVSQTRQGNVVALPDVDTDDKADRTVTILSDLDEPHGLYFHCPDTGFASADQDACKLYVAETGAVKAYTYDADTYTASNPQTITALPKGSGHSTRTLLLHPDGVHLLVSIGSSCNVCEEGNAMRASVQSIDLATSAVAPFASGLRNTVFMAIDPVTGAVWGTDNGRDLIGDDIPPDEVNIIEKGANYGWPICYGNNVHDTDFDNKQYIRDPCADMTPPHIELQAHSAALGIGFIPEEGWPEEMGNDALIAYHGSWNRSVPTGYKVVRINLDPRTRKAIGEPIDFLTGFLPEGSNDTGDAIGRPVGILAEPGGTVYISDDRAGAIYKIVRNSLE
ncbi:hypothetical protein C4568_02775 [Candidatus Parcubacteria bacterium]|nr:MAG: hypothetical protein C4568_02775 [Candidatus Parcubacteria bacterium]